ncbi:MAG TPA: tetratricopeptide repeat protein [Polyangiaceae bacterium]|nr:tetratricopeptide repeat protein [Polyangiaceae bacterium]
MLSGRKRRSGSPSGAALVASALWLFSATGHAQSTSDDMARRHFDSGVAYLEESDYENALKAFQKAYELSKRPEILLNIATVHERQSDLPSAVASLKGYLEAAPQGEHVETVKLRIQNLEKRIQEQEQARAAATAPTAPPPPAASPAPVQLAPVQPQPAPAAKPEPNRLPAFIALAAGGVMGGAALATGLVANAKYQDAKSSCQHHCTDDELSGSRTFAVTSTVLTGGAFLGVGLGVVLLLTMPSDGDSIGKRRPRFDVALGPSAAAASARWSF